MKTIIFKRLEYELLSLDVLASRLSASLVRGEYYIDTLLAEIAASKSITVKEDGDVIGVYKGYTNMLALTVYADSISVELTNDDIQSQIDAINKVQIAQGEAINALSDEVSEIAPFVSSKTAYINDTEVVFENVPSGALLVSFDNGNMNYSAIRDNGNLRVTFEPLSEVTEITIAVQ